MDRSLSRRAAELEAVRRPSGPVQRTILADKQCPNCGLWNHQAALVCDCGFEFASGLIHGAIPGGEPSSAMPAMIRGPLYGMLGALLAALPVSIFKTWAFFVGACRPLPAYVPDHPITLGGCGLLYYPSGVNPGASWLYVLIVLLGGALSGGFATAVVLRSATSRSCKVDHQSPAKAFWPSFAAAVLFDVLFVFIVLYPGQ